MKKKYIDLTLHEFLGAITHKKALYEIIIPIPNCKNEDRMSDVKKDVIDYLKGESIDIDDSDSLIDIFMKVKPVVGTKDRMINLCREVYKMLPPKYKNIKHEMKFVELIEDLRRQDMYESKYELSDLEIYNYLCHVTHDFDRKRVELILREIEKYYIFEYKTGLALKESYRMHIENGREIPLKKVNREDWNVGVKEETIPDIDEMLEFTHFGEDDEIKLAINILKSKIDTGNETSEHENSEAKIPKNIIDELSKESLINKETLQWKKIGGFCVLILSIVFFQKAIRTTFGKLEKKCLVSRIYPKGNTIMAATKKRMASLKTMT